MGWRICFTAFLRNQHGLLSSIYSPYPSVNTVTYCAYNASEPRSRAQLHHSKPPQLWAESSIEVVGQHHFCVPDERTDICHVLRAKNQESRGWHCSREASATECERQGVRWTCAGTSVDLLQQQHAHPLRGQAISGSGATLSATRVDLLPQNLALPHMKYRTTDADGGY